MARFDLTDYEWEVIQPMLPTKVRGGMQADHSENLFAGDYLSGGNGGHYGDANPG